MLVIFREKPQFSSLPLKCVAAKPKVCEIMASGEYAPKGFPVYQELKQLKRSLLKFERQFALCLWYGLPEQWPLVIGFEIY